MNDFELAKIIQLNKYNHKLQRVKLKNKEIDLLI